MVITYIDVVITIKYKNIKAIAQSITQTSLVTFKCLISIFVKLDPSYKIKQKMRIIKRHLLG